MAVIEAPTIVKRTINERFSSLLKNEPWRKQLAKYLIDMMISRNKTLAERTQVSGTFRNGNTLRKLNEKP